MAVILEGRSGRIYVGYAIAAELGSFRLRSQTVVLNQRSVDGVARILSADPFWITQPPTKIEFHIGSTSYTWTTRISLQQHPEQHFFELSAEGDPEITELGGQRAT
jgi:hypothetical protein